MFQLFFGGVDESPPATDHPVQEGEQCVDEDSERQDHHHDRDGRGHVGHVLRIFEQQRTRRAMIALFLATLEMVRMQAVVVIQKDLFGEIALKRHSNFDAVFASGQPMAAIEKDYI